MLICRIMVIGCVAALVSTLHVDDGCEAKSEWEEQIKWHEYHIRAWTSKNEQTLLEMTFGFKAMAIESDKDTIKLSRNGYKFIRTRDLTPNSQMHNISASMTDGWNEFMLSVDGNYTLRYIHLNDSYMLFTEKVDFKLQSITLQGSNITLNCPEKLRLWHVSGKPVTVPLSNATEHQLSFYSDEEMMASIKLGSRKYPLSWDGQGVTTLNKGPLPPFRLHNITISCSSSERDTCIIKANGEKTLEVVPMDRILQSVAVERRDGEPFTIILTDPHIALREIDPLTTTQPPSDDGATTIIGVLMIITAIAIVVIFMVVYHFKIKKLHKTTGNDGEILKIDDIEASKPLLDPQRTVQQISKNELLLEVIQNNPQKVQKLLQERQQNDSEEYKQANLEAHLLCRSKITRIFDCNSSMQRETLIRSVLDTFNLRVDQVFEATKKGIYNQGVVQLLQCYELPATIRNSEGHSLLHIIASSKGIDGFPVWNTVNLQKFLEISSVYANAVDFKGKTCLHFLVEAAKLNVNEKLTPSKSLWLEIAEILVEFGCDPRIKDDDDRLPQDYAKDRRNFELSQFFEEKCETLSASKDNTATFDDLVKYAKKGNINDTLKEALRSHQEFLPLNHNENLLTLSVTRGHFETTMLLLSAGAWKALCGRPFVSLTPLEAVHEQKSLPALFAAVIRSECINRLKFESSKVRQDQKLEKLTQHLQQLILSLEKGDLTKLSSKQQMDSEEELADGREARKLLCLAAENGLALTCQMMGLENVNLQPYPNEDKPTIKAITNGHIKVIPILYRDLQLPAFAHSDTSKLPSYSLDNVFDYEFTKLKKEYKNTKQEKRLESLKDLPCATEKIMIENEVLLSISKLGLVYIFHKLKMNNKDLDVNAIVDELTGCTMLHIAATYGRFSMVEYLLYDGKTDIMVKSKGGFTAAHLAAIRGHKECMDYLQFCMKGRNPKDRCDGNHTANEFLDGYEDLVKDSKIVLLSGETGVKVLSTPSLEEKTEISLKGKCKQFQITNEAKLLSFLDDMKDEENVREHILDEMTTLLQKVSEADDKLKGGVVAYHCNSTGLNIPTESMQIYWEVTSQMFNANTKHEESDGNCSVIVEFASGELEDNLSDYFYKAVRVTLKDFKFKSSAVWLLYPAIIKERMGVTLLLTMFEKGKSRLVSVLLVPVLKTDYPKDNIVNFSHHAMKNVKPMVYLAMQSQNWKYITVKMEDDIISKLTKEQRRVLAGCMMLTRMLYSCWWYPQQESRRHSRTWQSYSYPLRTLPDRVLTSLFLEEVNVTNDDAWDEAKILDRMISVFTRATENKNDQLYPKDNILLFLGCKHSSFKPQNNLVRVILKFLEDLK